ncbi:MAG: TolC family protein [Methylotenera sp.]|nr:TolC family protein [Oligoflexia bacterium]
MKSATPLKRGLTSTLVLTLCISLLGPLGLTSFSSAHAAANEVYSVSDTLIITPENLAAYLYAENTDIALQMNNVMKSRDRLSIARANLLPSLSFNILLPLTMNPRFLVSSISCLVPFLFPTNWFNKKAAKANYWAEYQGYLTTKLNTYATAATLMSSVAGDEAIYKVLLVQRQKLSDYVNQLKLEAELGLIPNNEKLRGEIELNRLDSDVSKVEQLVITEHAELRKMFGFDLDQKFDLRFHEFGPSTIETADMNKSVDDALNQSPELQQLMYLHTSARAGVHSAQWAFLSGCSGNQGTIGAGAFAASTSANVNIGFGYFPTIRLARKNVVEIEIRERELGYEFGRVIETTRATLKEGSEREALSLDTAAKAETMLEQQMAMFELGQVSVKEVLDTMAAISQAKIEAMSTHTTLVGNRITLKRVGMEGPFQAMLNGEL